MMTMKTGFKSLLHRYNVFQIQRIFAVKAKVKWCRSEEDISERRIDYEMFLHLSAAGRFTVMSSNQNVGDKSGSFQKNDVILK